MKCSLLVVVWCAISVLVVFLSNAPTGAAVTCSPSQLSSCAGAFMSNAQPSGTCCAKLKEQVPCFCQYYNNPTLRGYIFSPNAKKVASACGVPYPTNC